MLIAVTYLMIVMVIVLSIKWIVGSWTGQDVMVKDGTRESAYVLHVRVRVCVLLEHFHLLSHSDADAFL